MSFIKKYVRRSIFNLTPTKIMKKLIELLNSTESVTIKELGYWLKMLPNMSSTQKASLLKVLLEEKSLKEWVEAKYEEIFKRVELAENIVVEKWIIKTMWIFYWRNITIAIRSVTIFYYLIRILLW